jgi:DHA2 family multidrug resistance protein
VLFRILQGLFGATLVPLSQTVLLNINAKGRQGSAMALWGIAVMAGPVLGPVLGGWLTEVCSWCYVFSINLPIGIVAFLGMTTFLKETPRDATTKLDWFGFCTLSLAIGAMQVVLDRGEEELVRLRRDHHRNHHRSLGALSVPRPYLHRTRALRAAVAVP